MAHTCALDDSGRTPALDAARNGNLKYIIDRLSDGPEYAELINVIDGEGQTLAHMAARKGNLAGLKLLHANGVNVLSVKDRNGKIPFDLALTPPVKQWLKQLDERRIEKILLQQTQDLRHHMPNNTPDGIFDMITTLACPSPLCKSSPVADE